MKSIDSIGLRLDDLEKRAHRAIQAAAEGRTSLDSAKAEVEAVHRQIEYIQHDRDKQQRLAILSPGEHIIQPMTASEHERPQRPQRPQRPEPLSRTKPKGYDYERAVNDVWLVNGDTPVRCTCDSEKSPPHAAACNVARVARGEGLRRKGFRKPKPLTDHERTEVKALMLLRSDDPVPVAVEDPTDELIEDIEEELERTAPPRWNWGESDLLKVRGLFNPPLLWKNPEAYAILPSTTGGAPRATLVTEYLDYPPRLLEAVEPPMTAERQYAKYVEAKRSAGTTRVDPVTVRYEGVSLDRTVAKQQCDALGHVEVAGSDHCLRCMLSKHEQWIRANSLDIY